VPRLEPQSDQIPQTDFYEAAMQPDFPDEMAFQIDRDMADDDPESTFSQEAVNEIAEQFRMFLMARLVGKIEGTGVGPRHLRATVNLDWKPSRHPKGDPTVGPFFHIKGDEGMTPIDSTKRYDWKGGK